MLKPTTREQCFLAKTAEMAEDLRRRSEDILLRANRRRPAAEAPKADRTAHAVEMREIRQTVILAGDIIQQLRMAAAEGTQTADHIFSPDLSYENLSEEQAKKLKETRKEKEKAEKAESPGFRGRGRGRGRGGYGYHPYHPAPAAYAAPQYIQQQGVPAEPWGGQQQWVQPNYSGMAPPPSYGAQGGQVYHPDGYRAAQGIRQDTRAAARCFGCGGTGHFSKDGVCLPGSREAFQAMQQGQHSSGRPAMPAIGYTPPGSGN